MNCDSLDSLHLQDTWLAIGIFDGVHLGHQALLKRLVQGAHASGTQAAVFTFDPHPAVVLGGVKDMPCLTTPAERCALLVELGVDHVITQHFDRAFANQTALEFMRLTRQALGVRHLVLGYDTALGRGREGNPARLEQIGQELGFTVEVFTSIQHGQEVISSSRIRELLKSGEVQAAAALLGRPYSVTGTVIHGDGRGRHINLPTANLDYPSCKLIPANGIYATWAWVEGQRLRGATNIGTNPTFTPRRKAASLETHLLDFDQDLYGAEIRLDFVARLREEVKYSTVEALLEQIRLDIEHTRQVLE